MTERITERSIQRLRKAAPLAPSSHRIVWDVEPKGFGLRITLAGAVAFVLRYVLDGRERVMTIGAYPDLSASAARDEAVRLRGLIVAGQDPLASREDRRRSPTVSELCNRYLSDHARIHNKPRTVTTIEGLIETHIRPKLGHLKVPAVTRDEIVKFHQGMSGTPRHANHALAVLSKMMSCAEAWGLRKDGSNPCRLVARYPETKRDRFYSEAELKSIGRAVHDLQSTAKIHESSGNAIMLLAFTGCRVSEILGLRWSDVDLPQRCLIIRDAKAGSRRQIIGNLAKHFLDGIKRKGVWVMPAPDPERPLSVHVLENDWRKVRALAKLENARLHDLRHTVGTYASGAGANAFHVRDLLGHRTMAMTSRYVGKDTDPLLTLTDAVTRRIANAIMGRPAPANESTDSERKVS